LEKTNSVWIRRFEWFYSKRLDDELLKITHVWFKGLVRIMRDDLHEMICNPLKMFGSRD